MENNLNPSSEKSSKELRDEKSRDSKLEEQVLKTLGGSSNIEEKFNLLLKKYTESEKNCKKLNSTIKLNEKKYDLLLREKDILQKEYNKGVLMKDKLEQVCREQQKLIKCVKNESLSKIREEEEKRKESQAKFQDSINEISVTLNKNNEENMKLKEDNIEMSKKLNFLAEQYQTREKQLQKINEQIQLESQLHEAKLAKLQMEQAIEKESLLRDKQNALDELINCKKIIQELQSREEYLNQQIEVYTSKYDDFHNSLQKSNDIFTSYKAELEKMYKNSRKLEKECLEWKKKCESYNATVIQLATENHEKDELLTKYARQLGQLQKLLRALQAERNSLYQILKDNNIERPPIPVSTEEDVTTVTSMQSPHVIQSNAKMEQMAKNCAELKQTLSKLQNQVEQITSKQNEPTVSVENSNTKKGKSNKKSKTKGNKINSTTITQETSSSDNNLSEQTGNTLEITSETNLEKLQSSSTLQTDVSTSNGATEIPLDLSSAGNIKFSSENVNGATPLPTEAAVNNGNTNSNEDSHSIQQAQVHELNLQNETACENSKSTVNQEDSIKNENITCQTKENDGNASVNSLNGEISVTNTQVEVQISKDVPSSSEEINQITEDLNSKCEINEQQKLETNENVLSAAPPNNSNK